MIKKTFLPLLCLLSMTLYSQNTSGNQNISFLQPTGIPSTIDLENSLKALDTNSLTPSDLSTIAKGFSYSSSKIEAQNDLLLKIHSRNKGLAETLIIFRKQLSNSISEEKEMQEMIETVFMHYLVNTENGYSIKGKPNEKDFLYLLKKYAKSLGVDLVKNKYKQDVFQLEDRTVICKSCRQINFLQLSNAGITVNKIRYGRNDVIPSTAFNFNGSNYTLENAAILAEFSNLAYFNPEFIKKQLKINGFTSFKWIKGKKTDTEVFLTQKNNFQIICFRGTSSFTDVITDIKFNKKPAYGSKGKVHAGFQNSLNEVWVELEKAIDKNKKIIVTGHSLGGGLAQLLAHRLAVKNYGISGVYTFGSPRVGNSAFKKDYDSRIAHVTFLHINNKDAVAAIPPEILGFIHLGNIERRFDSIHNITQQNTKGNILNPTKEVRFDELNPIVQDDIKRQMEEAAESIKISSKFLKISPHEAESISYGTDFQEGMVDDHSIHEYIFKLACAIVDNEMMRIK